MLILPLAPSLWPLSTNRQTVTLIMRDGISHSGELSQRHAGQSRMHRMVNCFGPCAPNTKMRSMSPVRLGPVTREIMLG